MCKRSVSYSCKHWLHPLNAHDTRGRRCPGAPVVHGCSGLSGFAGSVGLRRSSSVSRRTPCNISSCTVCQVRATFDRTSNNPHAICLAKPGIPCFSSDAILVRGTVFLCAAGAAIAGSFAAALDFNCPSASAELFAALVLCGFDSLGSAFAQLCLVFA